MLFNAKNGRIPLGNTDMNYLSFGRGPSNLILIPGIGDGLKTARGMALPFACLYGMYARQYTVYAFSGKNALPRGCTTRGMAADILAAMDGLGVAQADVVGVSMGGMIAQHLAVDAPERVRRLVLAVTMPRVNETARGVISHWIRLAEAGDVKGLMIDMAEKSYSGSRLKRLRPLYPLLGCVGKPKSYGRFIAMARACLAHDAYERLRGVRCPTLVLGGVGDKIVGAAASVEIAEAIGGSRMHLYEGLGHAAYEEAKDFHQRILAFLTA